MNTLKLIVEREYANRVRKKIVHPDDYFDAVSLCCIGSLPMWLANLKDRERKKSLWWIIPASMLRNSNRTKNTILSSFTKMTHQAIIRQLATSFFAILTNTDDLSKNPKAVSLTSEKQAPMTCNRTSKKHFRQKLPSSVLEGLSTSANVDQATISEVKKNCRVERQYFAIHTQMERKSGSISETSTTVASIVGMFFTILIYMFYHGLRQHGDAGRNGKKRSRIVEVMYFVR
jgi:ABC-2 type transport system permease protein